MSKERPAAENLQDGVRAAMARWDVPGMAVATLRDGAVEAHGFGIASLETRQAVTADTLFQIGSITKVFTATLVMGLVEEGRLDLDAPVATYLPGLRLADPEALRRITLRHLLSHTSGLEGDRFDDHGMGDDALARAVAEFHTLRQLSAPGTLWTYGNSGFGLAGAAVERVLETTFEDAVRKRVFEPLKMERSFFFAHEAITYPVAVGHRQEPGTAIEVARPYPLPRASAAAGGIIATVGDLLRFAAAHLGDGSLDGGRVLAPESVRAMREPQTPAANFAEHYGIGWALRTVGGIGLVGHGGATNGFQAQLTLVPSRGFAIALLTNSGKGSAANRDVEEWALAHELGLSLEQPTPISLPPDTLARFSGRYRQPYADITVVVERDGLRLETVTRSPLTDRETTVPPRRLVPISEREFMVPDGESRLARVDFLPATDGHPERIRLGGRLADRVAGDPAS